MLRFTKRVILLVVMTVFGGCVIPQSQDTPVDHKRVLEPTTKRNYYLYVPSDYTPSRRWPLVITLHGTPPFDDDWMQIREWKALAEQKGFLVAAPKLRSTQGILPVVESVWKKQLLRDEETIQAVRNHLLRQYNIDRDRILLTGFSAGGFPMFFVGLRNPQQFHMLIGRAVNSDERIFEDVSLEDDTRRIPTVLIIGKDDPGLQKSSWEALRWLRRHGWNSKTSERDTVRGGHMRRPETAYMHWIRY